MIITGVYYYHNGTIRVSGKTLPGLHNELGDRGIIKKFSSKSRQRLALFVAETEVKFKTMITLTYQLNNKVTGQRAKKELREVLRYIDRKFPIVGYLWFLEFTKKGQVHFHILIDQKMTMYEKHKLAEKWALMTAGNQDEFDKIYYTHCQDGAISEIRKQDGAVRYALKYSLKMDCKTVPARFNGVGRFWGFNAKVREYIPKPDFVKINEEQLREVLKSQGNPVANFDNLPGIIFNRTIVPRETVNPENDD
jgi:hypothetical protein